MSFTGISANAIDSKATEVLLHHDPDYFSYRVKPTPLETIVSRLAETYRVGYDVSATLGFTEGNQRILGCYLAASNTILIDVALQAYRERFHFVLGHELGHLILHRHLTIEGERETNFIDTAEGINRKSALKTSADFLEWQANYFSSAMLLPKQMFTSALLGVVKELGLPPRLLVYVDDQMVTRRDFRLITEKLADFFQVSNAVAEYRLKGLGLVND